MGVASKITKACRRVPAPPCRGARTPEVIPETSGVGVPQSLAPPDKGAEEHRAEERVQKLTDEHVHKIDELLKRKEAEIMEV